MARRRKNKNRQKTKPKGPNVGFWGNVDALPAAKPDVTLATEAAIVPHSLGTPPLPGHEVVAGHYFTAVYDKAVTLSGALAAAAGLIEPEELFEEFNE